MILWFTRNVDALGILPTWMHIIRATPPGSEAQAAADTEMLRMARAADLWNAHCREAEVAE
jgi:hypothetical protein